LSGPSEAVFLGQITSLLVCGRLMGELMQRIGQPAVMGQLIVGVAFDLWIGTRRISIPRLSQPTRFAELSAASQDRVIQTEEQIAESEWLIAKSRRLLAQLGTKRLAEIH
jgi:hypothetical protein